MPDDSKIISLQNALDEREELAICRLWDEFRDAAAVLYEAQGYESLVPVLLTIERVKHHIVKIKHG